MISQAQHRGDITSHSSHFCAKGKQTGGVFLRVILPLRFISLLKDNRLVQTEGDPRRLPAQLSAQTRVTCEVPCCLMPAHCLTQNPVVFFPEQHSSCTDCPQPIYSQDLAFVLLDFHKAFFGPFPQFACVPSVDNLPLSISTIPFTLMSSVRLMRVSSIATSRILIKSLCSTDLRICFCSALLPSSQPPGRVQAINHKCLIQPYKLFFIHPDHSCKLHPYLDAGIL